MDVIGGKHEEIQKKTGGKPRNRKVAYITPAPMQSTNALELRSHQNKFIVLNGEGGLIDVPDGKPFIKAKPKI